MRDNAMKGFGSVPVTRRVPIDEYIEMAEGRESLCLVDQETGEADYYPTQVVLEALRITGLNDLIVTTYEQVEVAGGSPGKLAN